MFSSNGAKPRFMTESIYLPASPLVQADIDLYSFLFDRPNPYDDPIETPLLPVFTVPPPGPLHETSDLGLQKTWTLPEFKERVELCGRMLANPKWGLEVRKGDVVGLLAWNGIGFATAEFGTFWNYGTVSFMCPDWGMEQVYHQMKEAKTKVLMLHSSLLFTLGLPAAQRLSIPLHRIVLLDADAPPSDFLDREPYDFPGQHIFTIEELITLQKQDEGEHPSLGYITRRTPEEEGFNAEKDIALLCCTSGTTGNPKAVMLSHRSTVCDIIQCCGRPFDEVDNECLRGKRYISLPPWIHQAGQACGLILPFYKRMDNVILEKVDTKRFLELTRSYRPFEFLLYPSIISELLSPPLSKTTGPDIFRWARSVIVAGATVPVSMIQAWRDNFPTTPFRQGIGATELTAITMIQSCDSYNTTIGSCGQLVPGMKSLLIPIKPPEVPVDVGRSMQEEAIKKDDSPGELFLTGPNIMLGYLNSPKANSESLYHHNGETWYRTGDLVVTQNNGLDFYHISRVKDLLWCKKPSKEYGQWTCILPSVIENTLMKHGAVKECAVVGVPGGASGVLLKAYVVAMEGNVEDEELAEEIRRFTELRIKEELKGGLEFRSGIPKNICGKILRNQLLGSTDPK